jgi:hypothetical protein
MCTGRIFTEVPKDCCEDSGCEASTSPVLAPGESAFFSMYAPETDEEGVSFYRFGITPRLEGGLGYTWGDSRVLGDMNYVLKAEDASRPALLLGIGSRRTGGSDSSAFLSALKTMDWGGKSVRLNLGVAYTLRQSIEDPHAGHDMPEDPMDPMEPMASTGSDGDRKAFIIAGAAMPLGKSAAAGLQYDGRSIHAMFTGRAGSVNIGLMLLRMEDPAVSIGYSLNKW